LHKKERLVDICKQQQILDEEKSKHASFAQQKWFWFSIFFVQDAETCQSHSKA